MSVWLLVIGYWYIGTCQKESLPTFLPSHQARSTDLTVSLFHGLTLLKWKPHSGILNRSLLTTNHSLT